MLLLLFVHDAGQVWLVYAVMFCYGLSNTVIGPAQSALLTVILPSHLLADANGALRTAQESLRLIAPLAGAGLFAALGAHALAIIDATTFAAPILSQFALRFVEPPRQPAAQRWRAQMTAGIRHLARTSELRQVVIAAACATAVIGFNGPSPSPSPPTDCTGRPPSSVSCSPSKASEQSSVAPPLHH